MFRLLRVSVALVLVLGISSGALAQVPLIANAHDIAVDSAGNVYTTGVIKDSLSPYAAFLTTKHDTNGNELWVARYKDPASTSGGTALFLELDSAENVYVAGYNFIVGNNYNYVIVKYNSSGVEQWAVAYNGPANGLDIPTHMALDNAGNVYVTGYSEGSGTGYDIATVAYRPDGTALWSDVGYGPGIRRYSGPANYNDYGRAIAADSVGCVYVTGSIRMSYHDDDCVTIKYNSSGVVEWAARYNGPAGLGDYGNDFAVDFDGNVYVSGSSGGIGTGYDYATLKYGSDGSRLWVSRYSGTCELSHDYVYALELDQYGNVYVSGNSGGWSADNADYATVKYDSNGTEQWTARYNGPASGVDRLWDSDCLAVDSSGNVYITGYSDGIGTGDDFATVKYSSSGTELWVARYEGPNQDLSLSIALDEAGYVYVAGQSRGTGGTANYALIKYDGADGTMLWIANQQEVSPEVLIQDLIQDVGQLDSVNTPGLIQQLNAAFRAYMNKNYDAAIKIMQAIINLCNADSQLTDSDRNRLIAKANNVIAIIQAQQQ